MDERRYWVWLPDGERKQVLVRADIGACSKAFLHHITDVSSFWPLVQVDLSDEAQGVIRLAVKSYAKPT